MLAWHVICSKPNQEIRAAIELTKQAFQVFLPISRSKPLFPRYLFAQFDREKDNWGVIRSTRGCVDVLKSGFQPIIVRQPIIEAIMAYEDSPEEIATDPTYAKGQKVRIKNGLLAGYEGLFTGTDKQRVLAFLDILGNKVSVPVKDIAAA